MNIEEIDKLRKQIDEIENKYCILKDYNLVRAVFDKLKINEIELSNQEITESKSVYVLDRKENRVIIKKVGEE